MTELIAHLADVEAAKPGLGKQTADSTDLGIRKLWRACGDQPSGSDSGALLAVEESAELVLGDLVGVVREQAKKPGAVWHCDGLEVAPEQLQVAQLSALRGLEQDQGADASSPERATGLTCGSAYRVTCDIGPTSTRGKCHQNAEPTTTVSRRPGHATHGLSQCGARLRR